METTKSEASLVQNGQPANYFLADVGLRVLLFAATITAMMLIVTSKQTELVPVPGLSVLLPVEAKFTNTPALIYSISALSVVCLYSIITTLTSLAVIAKPTNAAKLLLYYAIWDTLMLAIMASQSGAAGGVAYIGLKGNKHVGWTKICNRYRKYCRHAGSSIAVSLFGSVVLIFLVTLSVLSLYRRVSK